MVVGRCAAIGVFFVVAGTPCVGILAGDFGQAESHQAHARNSAACRGCHDPQNSLRCESVVRRDAE